MKSVNIFFIVFTLVGLSALAQESILIESSQKSDSTFSQNQTIPSDSVHTYLNSAEAGFRYEAFEGTYSDRTFFYLQYGRKFKQVDAFAKVLRYSLGSTVGYLYETEAYWKFKKKGYSYFDAAYSNAEILPNYRLRAEIFQNVKQFEYSIGAGVVKPYNFRAIPLITGTFGIYFSDYFIYARPTFSYVDNGFTKSLFVQGRRYLTKTDFIGLSFLKGADTGTSRNINAVANAFGSDTYLIRINAQVKKGRYKIGAGLDYGGIFIPSQDEYAQYVGFDVFVNREF